MLLRRKSCPKLSSKESIQRIGETAASGWKFFKIWFKIWFKIIQLAHLILLFCPILVLILKNFPP